LLTPAQVIGMLGLAHFGNLWLALAALWIREAARVRLRSVPATEGPSSPDATLTSSTA
jgi:hypothetical protein